jgi:hypothetical protein
MEKILNVKDHKFVHNATANALYVSVFFVNFKMVTKNVNVIVNDIYIYYITLK